MQNTQVSKSQKEDEERMLEEKVADQIEIKAEIRSEFGKGPAGRGRRQGKTPGIVYGISGTKHFYLDAESFMKIFKRVSYNTIIKLHLDNWSTDVVIKDYDYNIVRNQIRHVDFFEVQWADKVNKSVPLKLVGKALGQKDGGIVRQSLFEVEVKSMPMFIPKKVEIDVTILRVGDELKVKNITPIDNVEIVTNTENLVVRLMSSKDLDEEKLKKDQQE